MSLATIALGNACSSSSKPPAPQALGLTCALSSGTATYSLSSPGAATAQSTLSSCKVADGTHGSQPNVRWFAIGLGPPSFTPGSGVLTFMVAADVTSPTLSSLVAWTWPGAFTSTLEDGGLDLAVANNFSSDFDAFDDAPVGAPAIAVDVDQLSANSATTDYPSTGGGTAAISDLAWPSGAGASGGFTLTLTNVALADGATVSGTFAIALTATGAVSGASSSGTGSSSGASSGGAQCVMGGEQCSSSNQCCGGGSCNAGACCVGSGIYCVEDSDCCSNNCVPSANSANCE